MMLEKDIQIALLKALSMDYRTKDIFFASVPNEGVGKGSSQFNAMKRTMLLKSMGLCSGFPDLILLKGGNVLFLEIKSKKGVLNENQKRVHTELKKQGFDVFVVKDVQTGLDLVASYFCC